MNHPIPNLRYVNAKDLEGTRFDNVEVDDINGEKLGDVDGFIVDVTDGRPRHIVVGAGWFFHKRFLLPIGHAVQGDPDGTKLIADVTKERVSRFPGFDKDHFEELTADELDRLDEALAIACATDDADVVDIDVESHYRLPNWWNSRSLKAPVRSRV